MKKKNEKEVVSKNFVSLSTYVENVLHEEDINFEKDKENSSYKISLACDSIDINIVIQCSEEHDFICVYAVPEYKVPANRRKILLPKINQLNLDNLSACLRMDEEDGMLSSKLFINTDGGITDTRILTAAMSQCFRMISDNMDSLMEIIYGKGTDELMALAFEKMDDGKEPVSC